MESIKKLKLLLELFPQGIIPNDSNDSGGESYSTISCPPITENSVHLFISALLSCK